MPPMPPTSEAAAATATLHNRDTNQVPQPSPAAAAAAAMTAAAETIDQTNSRSSTDNKINWPAGSCYFWYLRDSNGIPEGPGNNIFSSRNAYINRDGHLVMSVRQQQQQQQQQQQRCSDSHAGSSSSGSSSELTCGEVFLDRSLGLGEYEFTVITQPGHIHPALVASPFIYACEGNEFDVEYTCWGDVSCGFNCQYSVQPNTQQGAMRTFNIDKGSDYVTHVIRWLGSDHPDQLQFETLDKAGNVICSWTAAGGNNFKPGAERVHINHWIFQQSSQSSSLPELSEFTVANFKFTPLDQVAGRHQPLQQHMKQPAGEQQQ